MTSSAWRRSRRRTSGSPAGVEIGEDGPSQMALEDLAMMRAIHGSTVLYPSDATSAASLVVAMADHPGISYLRTTRGAYPVLYDAGTRFPIGGSKLVRSDPTDRVVLVGAGVTVHNCLAADMDPPRIVHLAVRGLPGSGKPAELMDKAEISARHIVAAARRLYGI